MLVVGPEWHIQVYNRLQFCGQVGEMLEETVDACHLVLCVSARDSIVVLPLILSPQPELQGRQCRRQACSSLPLPVDMNWCR